MRADCLTPWVGRWCATQRDGRFDQFGNRGGAIYAGWYAQLTVADTEFTTNYAADSGGALYFDWVLDSGTLVNNVFTSNQVRIRTTPLPSRRQTVRGVAKSQPRWALIAP